MSRLHVLSGVVLVVVVTVPLLMTGTPLAAAPQTVVPDAVATPATGRVLFIENAGQWPAGARFQVWGGPGTLWLAQDAVWLTVAERSDGAAPAGPRAEAFEQRELDRTAQPGTGVNLKLSFVGANPAAQLVPANPLTSTVSYFLGNNPTKWRPAVPVWGEVRYASLYPGVDLVLLGASGRWTWQFQGEPARADTGPVLRIEGADGMTLHGANLRLATAAGEVELPLPAAAFGYEVEFVTPAGFAEILAVPAGLVRPAPMAPQVPTDDPGDLLYSTFLGGSELDWGNAVALDAAGRVTVSGSTESSDFPTTPGIFDPSHNGSYDAFVVRLNATGNALDYANFLGGRGLDYGDNLTLDAAGRTTMTGWTESGNFPATPGAFDTSFNGGYDAFVVQLNAAGSALDYATFLGGSGSEYSTALALDAAGHATVSGWTESSDFPTTPGTFDPGFNGGIDAFVVRLNAAGSALDYATFLGGSDLDYGYALTLDAASSTTVTGRTGSSNFPTTPGAFDTSFNGYYDAFVVRLNATGSALDFGTFVGGSDRDLGGYALTLDAAGRVTVTGETESSDFPATPGAFDTGFNGGYDAFVVRLNAAGSALEYGTFLGGSGLDYGYSQALDGAGRATVSGWTESSDFPTTPGAFDPSFNGGDGDVFMVRLDAAGSALDYGTFLGGSARDLGGYALALDAAGRATVTGRTESNDFPTTPGAFDPSFNGSSDAFVSKLNLAPPCTLPWDIVPDGVVDVADITAIAIEWGQPAPPGYDFDGDGIVTIVDIQTVAAHWGSSCSRQARPVKLPLIRK